MRPGASAAPLPLLRGTAYGPLGPQSYWSAWPRQVRTRGLRYRMIIWFGGFFQVVTLSPVTRVSVSWVVFKTSPSSFDGRQEGLLTTPTLGVSCWPAGATGVSLHGSPVLRAAVCWWAHLVCPVHTFNYPAYSPKVKIILLTFERMENIIHFPSSL